MVLEDVHHLVPEQGRRLQEQAAEGAVEEVLPRIHWRLGCEQGCQVHPLAVHAGEQGAVKCIPSVSTNYLPGYTDHSQLLMFRPVTTISVTQATDTGNIRLVFAAVKETILQNALKDSGIL